MNLRHAAALALVGWYLMVPPTVEPTGFKVNPDAPISRWEHYKSFDTAKDCEENLHFLQEYAMKFTRAQRVHPTTTEEEGAAQYMLGECIEADDPRLKEK